MVSGISLNCKYPHGTIYVEVSLLDVNGTM